MKSLLEVLTKNKFFGVLLGSSYHSGDSELFSNDRYGSGICKCGNYESESGHGRDYGCEYRNDRDPGWLVSSVEWAKFLSPANLAPLAIIIGVVIMLTGTRRSTKDISSIIIGFGLLFVGITTMSSAVSPLQQSEEFRNIFVVLGGNPFLGNRSRSTGYGNYPEFFCICGNSAESGSSRTGSV